MRADARRNRDRIVAAARTLFAERGYDVPMAEIAQRAGVGVGTLYRRFPERDSLIREVAVMTLRRLAAIAEEASRTAGSGWAALGRFVIEAAEERVGALQTLDVRRHAAVRADPAVTDARDALTSALGGVVARAQAEGTMRADAHAADVLLLLVQLTRPIDFLPAGADRSFPQRLIRIALDGLAADHATTPLGDRQAPSSPTR